MSNTLIFFAAAIGFLTVLFLLASLLSAINDSQDGKEDRKTKNESTSPKGGINYTKRHPSVVIIENAINAYRRDQQSSDRSKAKREKFSLVLATLTLVFAVAAVGAAVYSARLLIEQNDINKTALVAVQRAFVTISSIETKSKTLAKDGGNKVFFIVQPIVVNEGNTQTRELRFVQGGTGMAVRQFPSSGPQEINTGEYIFGGGTNMEMMLAFGPPKKYFHPSDPEDLFLNDSSIQRFALGPRQKNLVGMVGFDEQEMRKAMEAGWGYYVYGAIRYYDVFPNTDEHITKFCYRFERDPANDDFAVLTRTCEYWNCTDAECNADRKAYSDRMAKSK